jgi:Leucine-rich repeat (LRR) protein
MIKEKIISASFLILFILVTPLYLHAQLLDSLSLAKEPIYTNLTEALKNPAKVYKLDLHKTKLKEIPKEVFTLTNLQELNLSKNKLTAIPKEIGKLKNLEVLNFSTNNIDTVPAEIGQLINIQKLILNQNVIDHLPTTIGNLTKMYFLDLWGNNIQEFPKEISKLKNTLKYIDMRVISIKDNLQEDMVTLLPNTKFLFSMSCNCN